MARTPKVAIIGGGIGGLAAAAAMHLRGIEVTVYERSAELQEIGAGLTLSPNALKALRLLGVEEEVLGIGFQHERQLVRSWRSGRTIVRNRGRGDPAQRFGGSFMTIHRADLLDALASAIPTDQVVLNKSCIGVDAKDNMAAAQFADGSEIEADVIVGADGIHSSVRTSLFGPDEPHFTGCVCWRGLVPAEAVAHIPTLDNLTAWWGPHGHVVHYRVRRGEMVNFVAHYDSDAWTEESWTHECGVEELLELYAKWHPSLLELFKSSETYYKWALYDRDPIEHWGRGRVTMLGDAVHPMLPYLGQGACMAIEDGCVLASVLAANQEDPSAALRTYEALRMPRTREVQLGSRQRARLNHLASPVGRLKRDLKLAWQDRFGKDQTMFRSAWIYEYDVAAVDIGGVDAG